MSDPLDPAAAVAATELLEAVVEDRGLLHALPPDLAQRLLMAAGRASRPSRAELKPLRQAKERERKAARRQRDEAMLQRTGIRVARAAPVFATPSGPAPRELGPPDPRDPTPDAALKGAARLDAPRSCYVCKADFTALHPFYDAMCVLCGDHNLRKREQTADLSGRTVLLTGGRVKIGYHAGIKLLRAGARLVVTTRFPVDAAARYAAEPDASDWMGRLAVVGLDLRNAVAVEEFCRRFLATEPRLDHIVNNACQTVRRPPAFYRHLMERERALDLPREARRLLAWGDGEARDRLVAGSIGSVGAGPSGAGRAGMVAAHGGTRDAEGARGAALSAEASQLALLPGEDALDLRLFPTGRLDADLQQVDRRDVNSWRLHAHEVPTIELLEVHLVNAVAPFVLNARLKEAMLRTEERDKHIVNVSAMEGQFYRTFKTARHPHTNMAKASLNMLTRTAAPDYVRDGIHMNSVDTGWITDEDPEEHAHRKVIEQGFHPPLDVVDGAARILDPIFVGANTGEHVWGRFLKDYREVDW